MAHKLLEIADLKINEVAQRDLSPAHVKRLAQDFDPMLVGTIHVAPAEEEGKFYVLDGQHRVAAARLSGHSAPFMCEIHDAINVSEQANRFLELNTTLTVRTQDKFRIRVTRGDEDAIAVEEAIRAAGFSVGTYGGGITATAACELIVREYGAEALTKTLNIIAEAWGHQPNRVALSSVFLRGLAEVISRPGIDYERLARMVSASTPMMIRNVADAERSRRSGLSVAQSLSNAFVMTYQGQLATAGR